MALFVFYFHNHLKFFSPAVVIKSCSVTSKPVHKKRKVSESTNSVFIKYIYCCLCLFVLGEVNEHLCCTSAMFCYDLMRSDWKLPNYSLCG